MDASKSVLEALQKLPEDERSAVEEALRREPHIVLEESDPLLFLEFDDGDERAAAERLAAFWRKKVEFFEDRAFRPLSALNGEGALSTQDVEVLKVGHQVFLPDASGEKTVLFLDSPRADEFGLGGRESRESRFRCLFYVLWRAAIKGKPAMFIRYTDNPNFDNARAKNFQHTVASLPLRIEKVVWLDSPPAQARRMFEQTVVPLYKSFLGKQICGMRSYISESPKNFLKNLLREGCSKQYLPPSVGGTWSYEAFQRWVEQQSVARNSLESQAGSVRSAIYSGLLSVVKESLRGESSDMSGKLLLMNLLKTQHESKPRGAISRTPNIAPSDPTSALSVYMQSTAQKRRCDSDLEDRLVDALKAPSGTLPVPDAALSDSILSFSLLSSGMVRRNGSNTASVESTLAHLSELEEPGMNGHTNGLVNGACAPKLSHEDMEQLLAGLSQGPRAAKMPRKSSVSRDRTLNETQAYVDAILDKDNRKSSSSSPPRTEGREDHSFIDSIQAILAEEEDNGKGDEEESLISSSLDFIFDEP